MIPFFSLPSAFNSQNWQRPFILFLFLLFCLPAIGFAQIAKHTISGFVRDKQTGENLIGVSVYNPLTGQGTATNTYGFYSITLPQDSVNLVISYVGYDRLDFRTYLTSDQEHNFNLVASNNLKTVEIVGSREEEIRESTRMSTISVPIAQIKTLPALFGEVDVLKTLQLLPGVQSGGEGSTGLYVRGGSPDQNLILLDGTPVYNASHLFGFFSVFNADALNNVELIKGGFPARYGGRLSSVLDISMKEGNMNEFQGEASIGLIASKFTIEAPIKKDTSSFIISGRRTYLDVLTRPFMKKELGVFGYYFYDLNAKVNYKVSQRDRLYLSAYTGYDEFYGYTENERNKDDVNLGWGNLTSALRWNHVVNSRLFANTHFTYTKYQFNIGAKSTSTYFNGQRDTTTIFSTRYFSNIRDLSVKTDFDYIPNTNHYIRFGGQVIHHSFKPGALQIDESNPNTEDDNVLIESQTLGTEGGIYIEDDIKITNLLKVNAGVRLAGFYVDKKLFHSLEPRLSARYILTENWSVKASYARTRQFIHLLTNSGIGLPTDLWVPATKKVEPQLADQVAVGVVRTLFNDAVEVSFEGYYKKMDNLIEYEEGADFLGTTDNNWQDKVTAGQGWSYGGEFFVQKKFGKTTGWVGYTLAWATRKFPELNGGEKFPYKYDRRHDMSVVVTHQLKENISVSGTWVYGTGNAITLSEGRYGLGNSSGSVDDIGSRNKFRMAPYHRLDLSISQTKKKKWGEVVNSFGVYNAYNRKNPYFVDFQRGYDTGQGYEQGKFIQVSLFPIIPSFSKSFKF